MRQENKTQNVRARTKTIFRDTYRAMIHELIKVRKELKLSQTVVAQQVGWPDHTYLSKIETLEKRLDVVELAQLAKIYGKPAAFFISFLEE
ncbi:MAG: helix-turn-helix transcriptional regulator [Spirochaetes bacterium]|nr:helix-turn-helix transcriptional regulator [Spirochaetota bacterium]